MPMLRFPEFDHAWLREVDGRLLWACVYGGAHRTRCLAVLGTLRVLVLERSVLRQSGGGNRRRNGA